MEQIKGNTMDLSRDGEQKRRLFIFKVRYKELKLVHSNPIQRVPFDLVHLVLQVQYLVRQFRKEKYVLV